MSRESAQTSVLAGASELALRGPEDTLGVAAHTTTIPASFVPAFVGNRWIVWAAPESDGIAERAVFVDRATGTTRVVGAVLGARDVDYHAHEAGARAFDSWRPRTDANARYVVALAEGGETAIVDVTTGAPAVTFPRVADTCYFGQPRASWRDPAAAPIRDATLVSCFDSQTRSVLVGELATGRTWLFEGASALHDMAGPVAVWTDEHEVMHAFSLFTDAPRELGAGRVEAVSRSGRWLFTRNESTASIVDMLGGATPISAAFVGESGPAVIFGDDEHAVAWSETRGVRDARGEIVRFDGRVHMFDLDTSRSVSFPGLACDTGATEEPYRFQAGVLETDATCSPGCPGERGAPRTRIYDLAHPTVVAEHVGPEETQSYSERMAARDSMIDAAAAFAHVGRESVGAFDDALALAVTERDVRVCDPHATCVTLDGAAADLAYVRLGDEATIAGIVDGEPALWNVRTGARVAFGAR